MRIFLDCECGCDVMKIEKIWTGDQNEGDVFWLCIYKANRMGLWQRIRQAWHYLRYGEFSHNDMTIKQTELERFIAFLSTAKSAEVEKDA